MLKFLKPLNANSGIKCQFDLIMKNSIEKEHPLIVLKLFTFTSWEGLDRFQLLTFAKYVAVTILC